MIKVGYTRAFIKKYNALESELRAEVKEKIELFKDHINHARLKVHKLHGDLSNYSSFSVNYRVRVVFQSVGKDHVLCVDVGDHEIYK